MFNLHCLNHLDADCQHRKCNLCDNKGDLKSPTISVRCPNNGIKLKVMGETMIGRVGTSMSKQQIKADRTKRSRKDFKENILPYLPPSDKKDFAKKGKKPK